MSKKLLIFLVAVCFSISFVLFTQSRGVRVVTKKGESFQLYKNSFALLIGIDNYSHGWPDLPGVKKDISDINNELSRHGFQVTILNNPTKALFLSKIDEFINLYGLAADNRLLFYLACHGHTERLTYGEEMGYIVPSDAPNPNRDKKGFLQKAVDMQQIEVYAKRIQAKHVLFIFDSCFSGSIFALGRAIPKVISYKTTKPVRQFITSGSADETVPDKSIFKQQFLEALRGEADSNQDVYVTGTELGEFLQSRVTNYSKGSQHPQYGKIRNPYLDKGDFVFVVQQSEEKIKDNAYKPNLPSNQEVDLNRFKEKARLKEEEMKAWETWQQKFKNSVEEAKKIDISNISAKDKKAAWERILNAYIQDNPYSSEDEQLRNDARDRIRFWENKISAYKPTSNFSSIQLRSSYQILSENEVGLMLEKKNFFSQKYSWNPEISNPDGDFKNQYESKNINGDEVVIDYATELMWHHSGSSYRMTYEKAKNWINNINSNGYAGYHDWRLPTVEEGASLLESSKKSGGFYIDPVFSERQIWIWTGDKFGSVGAWIVDFNHGDVSVVRYDHLDKGNFVRPVRSVK